LFNQLSIYFASDIDYAPRWRALRDDPSWAHINFCSTWIDEPDLGIKEQDPDYMDKAWQRNLGDVTGADLLVCYVPLPAKGQGRFIETGAALASFIPVLAVGTHFSSWTNHHLVMHCTTDEQMDAYLKKWLKGGGDSA